MIFQTSSPASSSAYAPLLHSDPDSQDDVTLSEHAALSKERSEERSGVRRRLSPLVYWACTLSLLCSAFNISLLGLNALSVNTGPSPPIEYGSSYLGLEATVRDPSMPPLHPITSFPTGIAQVNESDPRAVYVDVHRWASTFGMVYPEDRRILLSSTELTYIQFWAGDFGMERCALKLMVPSSAERDVLLSYPDTTLKIWQVKAPRGVNFHHLSWQNRPERGLLLTSWIVRHNSTMESEEYHCSSGSFQAFELECVGNGCRVDFHQSPKKKGLGFWLVQRPSI